MNLTARGPDLFSPCTPWVVQNLLGPFTSQELTLMESQHSHKYHLKLKTSEIQQMHEEACWGLLFLQSSFFSYLQGI